MAKLTGVRTIDMVNGEITKIAYDGAEYAKVDDPRAGDICEVCKAWGTIVEGDFYVITRISESFGKTFTHIGEDVNYFSHGFNYYRKVAAKTPQVSAPFAEMITERVKAVEKRVDALETREPAMEGADDTQDKPLIGATVKVVKSNHRRVAGDTIGAGYGRGGQGLVKIGATGEIVDVNSRGIYVKFAEDDMFSGVYNRDRFYLENGEYEVIAPTSAKPAQTIEHNGATYTLVDRKAQPGDIVYVTKEAEGTMEIPNDAYYHVNAYGEISGKTSCTFKVYPKRYNRTEANTLVYAPVAKPLKVGDYVKPLPSADDEYSVTDRRMKLGKVMTVTGDSFYVKIIAHEEERQVGREFYVGAKNFRKATDVEVAETTAPAKPKAGDIVVITANTNDSANNIGDIGKVCGGRALVRAVRVEVPGGPTSCNWTEYSDMRLATPAEIAEYEAAVAKAVAKKAPKLKEGDFAKTLKAGEFGDIKAGVVVKIDDLDCGGSYDPYEIGAEAGGTYDYFRPQDLEVIDAKDAVFTKLGRKPGEFKKGDIVRGERPDCVIYGYVEDVADLNKYGVRSFDGHYRAIYFDEGHSLELIAPAESRVDVPSGADPQ